MTFSSTCLSSVSSWRNSRRLRSTVQKLELAHTARNPPHSNQWFSNTKSKSKPTMTLPSMGILTKPRKTNFAFQFLEQESQAALPRFHKQRLLFRNSKPPHFQVSDSFLSFSSVPRSCVLSPVLPTQPSLSLPLFLSDLSANFQTLSILCNSGLNLWDEERENLDISGGASYIERATIATERAFLLPFSWTAVSTGGSSFLLWATKFSKEMENTTTATTQVQEVGTDAFRLPSWPNCARVRWRESGIVAAAHASTSLPPFLTAFECTHTYIGTYIPTPYIHSHPYIHPLSPYHAYIPISYIHHTSPYHAYIPISYIHHPSPYHAYITISYIYHPLPIYHAYTTHSNIIHTFPSIRTLPSPIPCMHSLTPLIPIPCIQSHPINTPPTPPYHVWMPISYKHSHLQTMHTCTSHACIFTLISYIHAHPMNTYNENKTKTPSLFQLLDFMYQHPIDLLWSKIFLLDIFVFECI